MIVVDHLPIRTMRIRHYRFRHPPPTLDAVVYFDLAVVVAVVAFAAAACTCFV